MELKPDEVLLSQCAGGICVVCKKRIEPGPAIQLNRFSNRIRHVECTPTKEKRKPTPHWRDIRDTVRNAVRRHKKG